MLRISDGGRHPLSRRVFITVREILTRGGYISFADFASPAECAESKLMSKAVPHQGALLLLKEKFRKNMLELWPLGAGRGGEGKRAVEDGILRGEPRNKRKNIRLGTVCSTEV